MPPPKPLYLIVHMWCAHLWTSTWCCPPRGRSFFFSWWKIPVETSSPHWTVLSRFLCRLSDLCCSWEYRFSSRWFQLPDTFTDPAGQVDGKFLGGSYTNFLSVWLDIDLLGFLRWLWHILVKHSFCKYFSVHCNYIIMWHSFVINIPLNQSIKVHACHKKGDEDQYSTIQSQLPNYNRLEQTDVMSKNMSSCDIFTLTLKDIQVLYKFPVPVCVWLTAMWKSKYTPSFFNIFGQTRI